MLEPKLFNVTPDGVQFAQPQDFNPWIKGIYRELGSAWNLRRADFSPAQNRRIKTVDTALALPSINVKSGMELKLPWEQDRTWVYSFDVDPNISPKVVVHAPVIVHPDRHPTQGKRIAEISVSFSAKSPLSDESREQLRDHLYCQDYPVLAQRIEVEDLGLPEELAELTYRPKVMSFFLAFNPESPAMKVKKSPLPDHPVYRTWVSRVQYFFEGMPVDFGMICPDPRLNLYMFNGGLPSNFPGVLVGAS